MNKGISNLVCLGIWLWLVGAACQADVIWLAGQDAPQYGRVRLLEGERIGFRAWDADQRRLGDEQVLEVRAVADWSINVDESRLQRRPLQSAQADLAYAEELAVQRRDPVAAQLARRLYLLAAMEGTPEVAQRALLGLRFLTTDAQRLQAIDRRLQLLRAAPARPAQPAQTPAEPDWTEVEGQLMLRLIQALRKQDRDTARRLLQTTDHQAWLGRWEPLCSAAQLQQMAQQENLAPEQLQVLLQVELWIETGTPGAGSAQQPDRLWLDLAREEGPGDILWPAWERLSEFDPRASRFRDGRWVTPLSGN